MGCIVSKAATPASYSPTVTRSAATTVVTVSPSLASRSETGSFDSLTLSPTASPAFREGEVRLAQLGLRTLTHSVANDLHSRTHRPSVVFSRGGTSDQASNE